MRIAGIVCDGPLTRIAARCGLGAVMGSKNLKAVVVRGTKKPGAMDEARLKATSKELLQLFSLVRSLPRGKHTETIAKNNRIGNLGVKNQSLGTWDVFNQKFQANYKGGEHLYCRLCSVGCQESHFIERDGVKVRQQVLEMLMPVGANCYIDDIEVLQDGYELCNRYGIDTISFGYAIAFAMELFEKGIISLKNTGGIDLTWGNHQSMLRLLSEIGENEGFGKVLGQGTRLAAEIIGKGAIKYAMQVKGLETTHWDPRIYNSLAIGYATGNKGGSHYESPGHAIERRQLNAPYGIDMVEFGCPKGATPLGLKGKADIVCKMQDIVCLMNSLVVCQYSFQLYGVKLAQYVNLLNA